jgi:hypothetical protein
VVPDGSTGTRYLLLKDSRETWTIRVVVCIQVRE